MQYNILIRTCEWYILQYLISWSDLVIWIWTENVLSHSTETWPLDKHKRHAYSFWLHCNISTLKFAWSQCSDLVLCLLTRAKSPVFFFGNKALVQRVCQTWRWCCTLNSERSEGWTSWIRSRWPDTAVSAFREADPDICKTRWGAPSQITQCKWSH